MFFQKFRDRYYLYRQQIKRQKILKQDFVKFKNQTNVLDNRFEILFDKTKTELNENSETLDFDRHYIYHTAWAFRKICEIEPAKLVDIGSSLYFIGMISAIFKTEHYDFRPPDLQLKNLTCGKIDLTHVLFPDKSIDCLSCMHVVEHIGLGRYGDTIDYTGDIKAINEIKRILKPKGNLLFVVPIGKKPSICFNLHRIYTKEQVLSYFENFELKEFSLIPENSKEGGIVCNPEVNILKNQEYACGCFWLIKK